MEAIKNLLCSMLDKALRAATMSDIGVSNITFGQLPQQRNVMQASICPHQSFLRIRVLIVNIKLRRRIFNG